MVEIDQIFEIVGQNYGLSIRKRAWNWYVSPELSRPFY